MVEYAGRARKVVYLSSNTKLPLFWPLSTRPAPSSWKHMLTHPKHAKPHHTICVAAHFHMMVFLPKNNLSLLSNSWLLDARPTPIHTSKSHYRNHFLWQMFLTHTRLCSITPHTYLCHNIHHVCALPTLPHNQSQINYECLKGRDYDWFSPDSQDSGYFPTQCFLNN